ncbi:hypothetical protein PTTG_11642 [Puccinia triticina 1-1 BBBD Race 1]|uniref:Uncharacterized protein n=1 Tax=Puccinia triticina (isolate 1-1 / race 1 (BBBD)) TaxID=630390 RepID=A0A180H2E4_PUCT1|nr:hypothetical protein PTTG_11642 [Puccinia triticina 1-1 BBBD Race 1]
MADSQESMISRLTNSFNSLGNEGSPKEVRHHEALVRAELARVHDAYFILWHGVNAPDPLAVFDQVDIRKELLDQLQSKRLPSLRRQVDSLSKAFIARSDLDKKPITKLKLVLKILSKLDVTMGKIKFAIACIQPELETADVRHDKDFKKLKSYTCCRLGLRIYTTNGYVCDLLQTYRRLIEESGHSFPQQPEKRAEVLTLTDACSGSIDEALTFMDQSELNYIQDEWRLCIEWITETLELFLEFVNRTTARLKKMETSRMRPHPGMSHARTSVIAAIKLSRLFVAQMLKISNDTENFRMVPDLTSRELDKFLTYTATIPSSIKCLVYGLSEDIGDDQFNDPAIIHKAITHTLSAPRIILLMLNYMFVPVCHQADQPSPRIYHKAWFCQWNKLYLLATQAFHQDPGFLVPQP